MMSKPVIEEEWYPYCHIWVENQTEPLTMRATNFMFTGWSRLWNKEDTSLMNTPHMFDCSLPPG